MAGEAVFVVDDESSIVQLVRLYLEREGYRVISLGDGGEALKMIHQVQPALVVLDIMLPGVDGLEVCRRLRAENNPAGILMLTARDEDIDKIIGLEMGADDYLTKPFNPRELVARVKAILRRGLPVTLSSTKAMINLGDLMINPASREVTINGNKVSLRHQEFNLLQVLAEHKGMVLSREQLLNLAWGYDYGGQTRTVDVHIGHLRKKIAQSQVKIETVTSDGYKLVV
jgi:DNA-binding response OmpR family regulator